MQKLTKEEILKTGVTEEQAEKIFNLQTKDRRTYHFLSYSGERDYIKEKVQTFKLNYFFFKIAKEHITEKEKRQLLNKGYKYRTLRNNKGYIFFLDSKAASVVNSSLGMAYFSKFKKTVTDLCIEKEEENNKLLDSSRVVEFLDFSGGDNE